MNFKELELQRERKKIRDVMAAGAFFYIPWYFIIIQVQSQVVDSLFARLIITGLFGFTWWQARSHKLQHSRLLDLMNISMLGVTLHFNLFMLENNWHIISQGLYLTTMSIVVLCSVRMQDFYKVSAAALILPYITMMNATPPLHEMVFFNLMNFTLQFFIGLTLRSNFSYRDEILKLSEANLANAKMAELGMLAAGMAHEINNPLAIIKGKSDLLIMKLVSNSNTDPEWIKSELAKIGSTVERVAKIVRGLKTFSRNSDKDPMISIDLGNWIQSTVELCVERIKKNQIALKIDPTPKVKISGRESQLVQVLLNLIMNSVDAIEKTEHPEIGIQFHIDENMLRIRVSDSGPGIPADIQARLAEPFFTTKPPGKGTGLGLSISRGIMQHHQGNLRYIPNLGHTCFELEIPLSQANTTTPAFKKTA